LFSLTCIVNALADFVNLLARHMQQFLRNLYYLPFSDDFQLFSQFTPEFETFLSFSSFPYLLFMLQYFS